MYFFDLDGTLLDSNGVWLDIDIAFLGQRGVSPVPADYTEYVTHHSAPDAAAYTRDRFALDETPEQIMTAWRDMARCAYAGQLALKPGAAELLQRCLREGRGLAILTSCMPELCRAALEHHGLTGLFRQILTTHELGLEKRDEVLYRLAAERCGVSPRECVLFEDSPGYCAAAARAGFAVAGVWDPLFADREEELRQICRVYLSALPGVEELERAGLLTRQTRG